MIDRLVILGSTITGLAVLRDAFAHGLAPLVVDTAPGIAFSSRFAAPRGLLAGADDATALARVLDEGGANAAIVATGDPWVRFVMRHRAALDARFGAVLHPSNAALDICLDKQRFAAWCTEQGIDAPKSWLAGVQPRPAGIGFPLLVRPAQTLHGRPGHGLPKAIEVHDEAELAALLARFAAADVGALVGESLLRPDVVQYSVPFARNAASLLSFVAHKVRPAPERCAVGTFVEMAPHDAVEAAARRAVIALDYFGIGEVEILHSASTGRACLIEINARPWLQYALAPASGHDFLGLMLGRGAPAQAPRRAGLRWMDLSSDLFGALSRSEGAVRHGQAPLLPYLASLLRANVHARFAWNDMRPAFHRPRAVAAPSAAASRPDRPDRPVAR